MRGAITILEPSHLLWISSVSIGLSAACLVLCGKELWDKLAMRFVGDLLPTFEQMGIPENQIPIFMRLWGAVVLAVILVFGVFLRMLPIVLVVLYLLFIAPRLIISWRLARARRRLRDQLVTASRGLADGVRSGLSLAKAINATADETQLPLRHTLWSIHLQYNRGKPLSEAIADAKQELDLDSFTLLANAVLVSLEKGGQIPDALERISVSLAENQRLERKIDSETATGQAVVATLALFPVLFVGVFFLVDPEGMGQVFTTLYGQLLVAAVIMLTYGAMVWSKKIMKIE
ncbi:type II secretion system F family protein [Rubripirellula amarantea]|nr:type II secretion system F family protein [Rubripirellula amarantea]